MTNPKPCPWCFRRKCNHCRCPGHNEYVCKTHIQGEQCTNQKYRNRSICNPCLRERRIVSKFMDIYQLNTYTSTRYIRILLLRLMLRRCCTQRPNSVWFCDHAHPSVQTCKMSKLTPLLAVVAWNSISPANDMSWTLLCTCICYKRT